MDAAIGDEIVGNVLRCVDGNGEPDARCRARGRVDRGVDADDFAVRIDQRAAGIAAVDGRIRLNGFVNESGLAGLHRAPKRADNAGRERGLETERVAERKDFLAQDRKSTRLNSSHTVISYAVFCLKKKKQLRTSPA